MIDISSVELLRAMKLSAMASECEKQLSDSAAYSQLEFEERLSLIIDAEWQRRQINKLSKFTRNARFSVPSASIEGIEYFDDRRLDKAQILRFATCKYLDDGHHIILKGASGNGKTYLTCAIGKVVSTHPIIDTALASHSVQPLIIYICIPT